MAIRPSRAPESQLVEQVLRLRTDVDGLKSAQLVGGANVIGYIASVAGLYDISYTVPANSRLNKRIDLIPNGATYAPFAQLFLYYSFNSDVLTYAIPPYQNGSAVLMAVQDLPLNGQTNQWYVSFYNTSASDQVIYVKAVFNTSALGNLAYYSLP